MKAEGRCWEARHQEPHTRHRWKGVTVDWICPGYPPPGLRDNERVNEARIDIVDGYGTYPTATGSLPFCTGCGNLVGDKAIHNETCEHRS